MSNRVGPSLFSKPRDIWVWVKSKPPENRKFWSGLPFAAAGHFGGYPIFDPQPYVGPSSPGKEAVYQICAVGGCGGAGHVPVPVLSCRLLIGEAKAEIDPGLEGKGPELISCFSEGHVCMADGISATGARLERLLCCGRQSPLP